MSKSANILYFRQQAKKRFRRAMKHPFFVTYTEIFGMKWPKPTRRKTGNRFIDSMNDTFDRVIKEALDNYFSGGEPVPWPRWESIGSQGKLLDLEVLEPEEALKA